MNADQQHLFRRIADLIYRDDCDMAEACEVTIHTVVSLARALHIPLDVLQRGIERAYNLPKENMLE